MSAERPAANRQERTKNGTETTSTAYDRALNGERFSTWEMFGAAGDRSIVEVDATDYVKTLEVHNQELRRQIATLAADLEMKRAK